MASICTLPNTACALLPSRSASSNGLGDRLGPRFNVRGDASWLLPFCRLARPMLTGVQHCLLEALSHESRQKAAGQKLHARGQALETILFSQELKGWCAVAPPPLSGYTASGVRQHRSGFAQSLMAVRMAAWWPCLAPVRTVQRIVEGQPPRLACAATGWLLAGYCLMGAWATGANLAAPTLNRMPQPTLRHGRPDSSQHRPPPDHVTASLPFARWVSQPLLPAEQLGDCTLSHAAVNARTPQGRSNLLNHKGMGQETSAGMHQRSSYLRSDHRPKHNLANRCNRFELPRMHNSYSRPDPDCAVARPRMRIHGHKHPRSCRFHALVLGGLTCQEAAISGTVLHFLTAHYQLQADTSIACCASSCRSPCHCVCSMLLKQAWATCCEGRHSHLPCFVCL
jgi:hypothetical protein